VSEAAVEASHAFGSPSRDARVFEPWVCPLAPKPKISAAARTFPASPLVIAKAPRYAPRTKCVAPAQAGSFSSASRGTEAIAVRRLPTMTYARSRLEPRDISPTNVAPKVGRFARISSASASWSVSVLRSTPMNPYVPGALQPESTRSVLQS
jgi:hypothetical protein